MKPIEVSREVNAPIEIVFETVSDVRNFRQAVPHITNIEFLTDQKTGTGTRFKETRLMNGRESTVELEITEFQPNRSVRIESDAGGTIWDTLFTVSSASHNVVRLDMKMDIKPHSFMAKLTTRLIRGLVAKAVAADMDAVKKHCEQQVAE